MSNENIIIVNSEVIPKKTRNKPSKYTEEEKRERHKEALKRYYEKQDKRVMIKDYYKNKYENMTDEEKKTFINYNNQKYYNMTEEEKKEYNIKLRPYKQKYYHKMKESLHSQAYASEQILNNSVVCV